jgi:type II secretory pathway pseudopilin PulG
MKMTLREKIYLVLLAVVACATAFYLVSKHTQVDAAQAALNAEAATSTDQDQQAELYSLIGSGSGSASSGSGTISSPTSSGASLSDSVSNYSDPDLDSLLDALEKNDLSYNQPDPTYSTVTPITDNSSSFLTTLNQLTNPSETDSHQTTGGETSTTASGIVSNGSTPGSPSVGIVGGSTRPMIHATAL